MMIFGKKQDGHLPQTKLQKRISGISTPDLVLWAENSLYIIGKELTTWQKNKDPFLLQDSELGAEALYEIVKELKRRS